MEVGDSYEAVSGLGGGVNGGVQGGLAGVTATAEASSTSSVSFRKIDSNHLEVTVAESEALKGGLGLAAMGSGIGGQVTAGVGQAITLELDLTHARSREALAVLKDDGFAAFMKRFGADKTLWVRTRTENTTSKGDGMSVSGLGVATYGDTSTVDDKETIDRDGNVSKERKGTGGQSVGFFGQTYKKEASANAILNHGEAPRVVLEAGAEGTNQNDVRKGIGGMLNARPGADVDAGAGEVKAKASLELTQYEIDLLQRVCATSGTVTVKTPNGGTREVGRWMLQWLGNGDAHEELFAAAKKDQRTFVLALATYQAAKGPAGLEAMVRTLGIGGKFDFTIVGDKILGKENMLRRKGVLRTAEGHLSGGQPAKARAVVRDLKYELDYAEKSLLDGSYAASMPGLNRKAELDVVAGEKKDLLAFEASLAKAETVVTTKKDTERKRDFNGAGAENAVCEAKPADDPAEVGFAMVPAMFREGAGRQQTFADPQQLDPERAAKDKAWAEVKAKKAGLDAAFKKSEEVYGGFRVRHYAHFKPNTRSRKGSPSEWLSENNSASEAAHDQADAGATNLKYIRRMVLRTSKQLEADYFDAEAKDPQKRSSKELDWLQTTFSKIETNIGFVTSEANRLTALLERADPGHVADINYASNNITPEYLY